MSLFSGLDVASAADNPFEVEPGTYRAVVSKVTTDKTKQGDKFGMLIEYTIDDENAGPSNGNSVSEWKRIPHNEDAVPLNEGEKARALSFLKQRLMNLGIPEARMNDVTPDDLMGIRVVISVKKNGEYTNVAKVDLDQTESGAVSFG